MPTVVKAYLGNVPLFDAAGYQRPADWLPLPAAEAQSVKILKAVLDQTENYTMLRMNLSPASSTYQVDWGDGVVENFDSNVNALHNYNFNNPALNGTLCSRGYKQAIIKITPTSSGSFKFCTLNLKSPSPSGLQAYNTGFLDINVNLPSLIEGTRLQIGGGAVRHTNLERVNISSWGGLTLANSLFLNCNRLQSLNENEWDMSNILSITGMFTSCHALKSLDCSSWNISALSNWSNAFLDCRGLVSYKAPSGTIPIGGNLNAAWAACSSLEGLNLSGLNVSNVTDIGALIQNCFALRNVNFTGWNTSAVTNAASTFTNCYSLQQIPALNLSAVTEAGTFASQCNSLIRMQATGINVSVNMSSCMLGADDLNEIYTNLSANGTGKTITVTGNYGTSSDDPSIATAKGWTVTG